MANLFTKAAVCTDLHYGLKSNSLQHNNDCYNFIKWFIEEAKRENCDTVLFLGDWHNHRASINIHTLQYSLRSLEMLNENFDRVFFIPGNHDLYYKDSRDISSIEFAQHLKNIHICNEFFNEGDVVIAPWLVSDDYKKIQKLEGKYMFGHFELPRFKMNAMVEMPDHGGLNTTQMSHFDKVFSGHFHMRQTQGNVTYMGNCFPHNYSDVNSDDRGMMILEWGKEPNYRAWPDQPLYRYYTLSELVNNPAELMKPNMHIRVELDIDISYEEANYLKETFVDEYKLRELSLVTNRKTGVDEDLSPGDIVFESVDQIVTDQITKIDSNSIDPGLLLKIYQSL